MHTVESARNLVAGRLLPRSQTELPAPLRRPPTVVVGMPQPQADQRHPLP
jgi:hypothetical protein